MENKLEELKNELNQMVNDKKCSMDEILKISSNIDKEIEKVYFSN